MKKRTHTNKYIDIPVYKHGIGLNRTAPLPQTPDPAISVFVFFRLSLLHCWNVNTVIYIMAHLLAFALLQFCNPQIIKEDNQCTVTGVQLQFS